jgi:4-amino-4-deoxy-L-arabinose transferase-like glycosyltransferase
MDAPALPTHQQKTTWVFLLAIFAIAAALRVPIANIPLERDEGEYAYIAQRWLDGAIPYQDSFDQKPPGVFVVYALTLLTLGGTPADIHWAATIYTFGTLTLIFFLGRRLFSPAAGFAAGAFAAFLIGDRGVLGQAANTETFMILPLTAGFLTTLLTVERQSVRWAFVTGVCAGLAMLFKQVAATSFLFCFIYMLWRSDQRIRMAAATVAGGVCVVLPVVAYFYGVGAFREFYDCVIGYNVHYSNLVPLHKYWDNFKGHTLLVLHNGWPVYGLAAVGAVAVGMRRPDFLVMLAVLGVLLLTGGFLFSHGPTPQQNGPAPQQITTDAATVLYYTVVAFYILSLAWRLFRWLKDEEERSNLERRSPASNIPLLLLWGLFGFAAVGIGGTFRHHYFLQIVPAVALLAGWCVDAIGRWLWPSGTNETPKAGLAFGVVAAALLCGVFSGHSYYSLKRSPASKSRDLYASNPFPEAITLARFLKTHTSPQDTVLVFGSEPEIYFYAHRKSATRYIFIYPLMNAFPDTLKRQNDFFREIQKNRPRYIVYVTGRLASGSFLTTPDTRRGFFDEFDAMTQRSYQPAGWMPWGIAPDFKLIGNPWTRREIERTRGTDECPLFTDMTLLQGMDPQPENTLVRLYELKEPVQNAK